MKTIVLFYSFSGHTGAIAKEFAANEAAAKVAAAGESADIADTVNIADTVDIVELKAAKPIGKFKAYTAGIFAAIRGKAWPILPLGVQLEQYERLVLFAPIWAGNAAPVFNAIIEQLPGGKSVALKMVSMSGGSNCKVRLEAAIKAKNCVMESFEDIKG